MRTPIYGGPDVIEFPFQPVQPVACLVGVHTEQGLIDDDVPEILRMTCLQGWRFPTLSESFHRVGANGLKHPKPRLAAGCLFLAQEAVVYQRGKTFQNIELAFHVANRFGGFE